jgi:hypothetical protein
MFSREKVNRFPIDPGVPSVPRVLFDGELSFLVGRAADNDIPGSAGSLTGNSHSTGCEMRVVPVFVDETLTPSVVIEGRLLEPGPGGLDPRQRRLSSFPGKGTRPHPA